MNHNSSVFRNSCLKVPVDPISKMPRSSYERREKQIPERCSIESSSTCSIAPDLDAAKLKDFYRSIPDYNDIHHLPADEFYSTLKSLRERKKVMLGLAIDHIDCNGDIDKTLGKLFTKPEDSRPCSVMNKNIKTKMNTTLRRKLSTEGTGKRATDIPKSTDSIRSAGDYFITKNPGTCLKRPTQKTLADGASKNVNSELKVASLKSNLDKSKIEKPKRNHSACSISWNDAKVEPKTEIDQKFDEFFIGRKYPTIGSNRDDFDDFKTQSMPSSPLRMKRSLSPCRRRRSITIPKPFKMTERDEEDRTVNELRSLQKSFSEDMLHQKCERTRKFRARPVPIESRIPLYDKILEDQAMRRAITKINSEAELRAQMQPFSFTKREEKGDGICERATHALPKPKKKKRFRARPVPKNLFSNYFYSRMKEDEFFRSMNKRIRAEEMLRTANYPGSMAARDRSRLSTPAAHSDLPIDPSPGVPSTSSSERRCASPTKKRRDKPKEEFVTTSPQPFRFNTADRAAKKMQDVARKIYQESKSTESVGGSNPDGPRARAYSALELRASAAGRSNLAALLRAEAVRSRFEVESARRVADQRRRAEMKHRDRLLRSKPAWHLVKNKGFWKNSLPKSVSKQIQYGSAPSSTTSSLNISHEEDIAMRLQTRRDEERMRREEFLHEMELMYGRVSEQPMLFERYYAPRYASPIDAIQLSPRKVKKKTKKSYHFTSPDRSRKVSINDTAETYNGDVVEYLNRIDIEDKLSDSEGSLDRCKF